MVRYQHFVRKTTDAPEVKTVAGSVCASGTWSFTVNSHGYSLGDEILFSGFSGGSTINGVHVVSNVINANAFSVSFPCGSGIITDGFVQLIDDSTYTEVFPLGFLPASFVYEQPEGQIFFTHKLSGQLTFTNRLGVTDYSLFYNAQLDSAGLVANACIGYEYLIKQECDGVFEDYYEAKFSLHDGEWDLDRCIFKIEPIPNTLYDCILNETLVNVLDASPTVTTLYEDGSNPDRNYTNSRTFTSVLEYLISQTCSELFGVVSDFFQINPETTSTISYVTGEVNPYTVMTLSAVKDVKEPIPSTLQTDVTTTFASFMRELNSLFNVYFIIENNYVRIEHVSYFEALTGLDLTLPRYNNFDTGKNKYTYLEVPRTESLIHSGIKFIKVLYDNDCSIEKKRDDKIISSFITTLVSARSGDFRGDDEGLILWATVYNGGIGKYVVIGSVNNTLHPNVLFVKFFRHNRAQAIGSLNTFAFDRVIYDNFLIYSSKKNKLQAEIKIPLCCDDDFDSEDKIKTELGFGLVENAEFSVKDDTLKLQLKYGASNVEDIASPGDISGLGLWLESTLGITDVGGFVSVWADQSGNGRNATQATGAKQPLLAIVNGRQVVRFDGVNDGMSTSSFQTFPSKRGSVFIVFRNDQPTTVLTNDHLVGTNGNGAGTMWSISTDGDGSDFKTPNFNTGGILVNAQIAPSTTVGVTYGYSDFVLISAIRNSDTTIKGAGNGNWANIGNVGLVSGNSSIPQLLTIANTQPNANPVNIGNGFIAGNSDPFAGYIAEIIIYDRDLSDYERQQVEQYLFKKYSFLFQYT